MAKPTAIVVWFDDNTRYHIDPAAVKSLFIDVAAATLCGHEPPHEVPGPAAPVRGPFKDNAGPPSTGGSSTMTATTTTTTTSATSDTTTTTETGTCYYVNGMIVCN